MRLVDDEQPCASGEVGQLLGAEGRVVEPFRADEQDVDRVVGERLTYLRPVESVGGVHCHCADPGACRGGDLVAHERQQR